jgi:hypothetical protein
MLLSPKAEKEDLMTGRCERCGSALIPEKPLPPKEKIEELNLPSLAVCDYGDTDRVVKHLLTLGKKVQELIRHCNGEEL